MNAERFNSPRRCRERERLGWRSLRAVSALALVLALSARALPHSGADGTDGGESSGKDAVLLAPAAPAPPHPSPDFSPLPFPLSSPPPPDIRPAQLPSLPPRPDSSPLPLTSLPASEVLPSPSIPPFEADIRLTEESTPEPSSASAHAAKAHAPSPANAQTPSRATASSAPTPGKESRVRAARYRSTPRPPYPPLLREQHIEGSVRVRILLDASGRPTAVDILTGSGHAAFDDTARRWILNHWTFYPAERDGKAIPGRVVTQIHFVME